MANRNMPTRCLPSWRSLMVGLLCLLVAGCAGDAVPDPSSSRLEGIAKIYSRYRIKNRGQWPKNLEALTSFAATDSGLDAVLKQAKVSDVGALFASDGGGGEVVVLFGKAAADQADGIVAYDSQTHGGQRMVAFAAGYAAMIGEDDFSVADP